MKASAGGRGGAEMSFRSAEGMSIMQALAMTVAEIPVFLYSTFGQVRTSIYDHTPHNCSIHTQLLYTTVVLDFSGLLSNKNDNMSEGVCEGITTAQV